MAATTSKAATAHLKRVLVYHFANSLGGRGLIMQQELTRGLVFMVGVLAATAPWTPVFSQDDDSEPLTERAMVSPGLDSETLAMAYPDQAVWLESERFGRALALFEPEQTAQPRGAVLLLADEGQSADAGLAGAVRGLFAKAGWAAMTLGLPALPLALEPARKAERQPPDAADADAAPEPQSIMIDVMESDDVLDDLREDYRARIQAHLAAAVVDLKARGYSRLVLVGVGRGAGHAISQVAGGAAGPAALVLIAPEFETAERQPAIDSLSAVATLSLLDIVSSRSDRAAAKVRQSRMKREGMTGYQQQAVAMGPRPLPRDARGLVNRVTAWLRPRD